MNTQTNEDLGLKKNSRPVISARPSRSLDRSKSFRPSSAAPVSLKRKPMSLPAIKIERAKEESKPLITIESFLNKNK